MTQAPSQASLIRIKPQSNIYTLLIILAVLAMGVTVGIAMWSLMSPTPQGYGLSFESLFKPFELPPS